MQIECLHAVYNIINVKLGMKKLPARSVQMPTDAYKQKNFKSPPPTGKVTLSMFSDSQCVILMNFLRKE